MITNQSVGSRIREERLARELSARELATRAGVAPSTITHAEAHVHTPRLESLLKIAGALGVEVKELL